jgi:hypothetical protein
VSSRLVPERELNPIPQSKSVIDDTKIILYDMLSHADGFCDFTVFEPLGNKLDDPLLSFGKDAASVEFSPKHGWLQPPHWLEALWPDFRCTK